ncbi:MAG: hypothetical protein HXY43_03680 [Fischerella sp.]|jgi:hypothetical protein|nr:hypothetical protein [Fischerella sp.]NWF58421.1 hypothetical protein [Fischerella sp.]
MFVLALVGFAGLVVEITIAFIQSESVVVEFEIFRILQVIDNTVDIK